MPTKRVKGKKKLKSIKAKLTDSMGSKRRLAKFGKEQKKGMKGSAANYITRSQALKRLQISLKDFRRLCILKGIYPREPKKKPSGKDKTYYYLKDVMFLAHEPILYKFRELKTFMKKVTRSIGKGHLKDARRRHDNRPQYSLSHIVKERYPRFMDAIGDLDDALCLIHLFSNMPTGRGVKAEITSNCLTLVREWQNYIVLTKSLTKVFVSIKGIYYQASVHGQPVTWVVPHKFTPTVDKRVDMRVMLTFLEFYQVLLKFVNYQLYAEIGYAYPPAIDLELDQAGAMLSAIQLEKTVNEDEDITSVDGNDEIGEKQVTEQQKESEKRIKSLSFEPEDLANGDDDEDELPPQHMREELEEAFSSNELAAKLHIEQQKEISESSGLFRNLVFFLSREVPYGTLEFVLKAHGAKIGWEGETSPFPEKSEFITHHIMDRPHQGHRYFNREYIQPQWVFDSINNSIRLPVVRYAPGASLPPHLSPFVDDNAEGYTPKYKKQILSMKSAVDVMKDIEMNDEREEEDDVDDEAVYAAGLKNEADGEMIDNKTSDSDADSADEGDNVEDINTNTKTQQESSNTTNGKRKAEIAINGLKSKKAKQKEEDAELHELAKTMMSKKAKYLYDRMQHGLGKKAEKIKKLVEKAADIDRGILPPKGGKKSRKKGSN